jgi:hypothetical protein
MGSFYQPLSYLSGGKKRSTRKTNGNKKRRCTYGGFYPSVMGGVMRSGTYLLPIVFKHGSKLFSSKSKKSKKSKTLRKK